MTFESRDFFTKLGTFNISPTRKVFGELNWQGEESYLYVGDEQKIGDYDLIRYITGSLNDLQKVTLIDCVPQGGPSFQSNASGVFYSVRYFPHYTITGHSYFDVDETEIDEFSFVIEDFSALFHDLNAFNTRVGKSDFTAEVIKNIEESQQVKMGEMPIIAYYTGNSKVIEIETVLGTINVNHRPSFNSGGPNGVTISNSIAISIKPKSAIKLEESMTCTLDLLRFLEVVIGRAQKVTNFVLQVSNSAKESPGFFNLYWSLGPAHNRPAHLDKNEPSPFGVLIDPIRNEENFKKVLANWLNVNQERKRARGRFSNSFGSGNFYTVDRLICAANMFDILPNSAVPKDEVLSDELLIAKEKCLEIFTSLPNSYERGSVLSALGRVGKCSLKHKIRHRVGYITRAVGNQLEDIQLVADEAVNCRNYFVHGSKAKLDYEHPDFSLSFLTNTLEFIFAISELVEAGWGFNQWLNKLSSMSHPFKRYTVEYAKDLAILKRLLNS